MLSFLLSLRSSKDSFPKTCMPVLFLLCCYLQLFHHFLLRGTITYYNKKGEEAVQNAAKEAKRSMQKLDATGSTDDEVLVEGIKNRTCVFLCIQTQSEAKWGLLINLMRIMAEVSSVLKSFSSRINDCIVLMIGLRKN